MRTKKFSKTLLLFGALYINLVVCIAGSIFGTYAWYQYSSRASVSYDGTAVGDAGSFEIGLVSPISIPELSNLGLTLDNTSVPGKIVYWSNNEASSDVMSAYELALNYGAYNVAPTSSCKYEEGDTLSLRRAPTLLENRFDKDANTRFYSRYELAFKISGGTSVYLTDAKLECENNIESAFRIHFSNPLDKNQNFIFNPTQYDNGKTDVAGVLDLNRDGFYDYFGIEEYLYGEYLDKTIGPANDGLENIVPEDLLSTFNANHKNGYRTPSFTPYSASYYGRNETLSSKELSSLTGSSSVILLDCTVYLEGWDRSCIDLTDEVSYNLKLEFDSTI